MRNRRSAAPRLPPARLADPQDVGPLGLRPGKFNVEFARIADEIKNSLVSINALMGLIGGRYDDVTFRTQFSTVVGRDVQRLVQIFDKLAMLVNEGDYKRDVVDLGVMVEECRHWP